MKEFKKFTKKSFLKGNMETNKEDRKILKETVKDFYKSENLSGEMFKQFVVHNKQVEDFVIRFSKEENFNEREKEIAILSAILHDIAKGSGEFELHGREGGKIAKKILLKMGKSSDLAESVKLAIIRHMGRGGYPTKMAKEKYGNNFEYPEPATKVGQLVYDCDILTQLTTEGFRKILYLRKTDQEDIKEDQKIALEKNITQKQAALLSVLGSAMKSYNLIKIKSVKKFAEKLWREIQKDYADYFKNGKLVK